MAEITEARAEELATAKRIAELEVGIRRAIHLVETIRPLVMWPIDDPHEIYTEEWADTSLDLVRDALAGKET